MCDTFYSIPREIAGMPVFGFGLLLAAWALFSVILLVVVARRAGIGGELFSYVPLLLLVAAAIAWFLPKICDDHGLAIHGYGVMLLIAVVSSTTLLVWRAKPFGLDSDTIVSLVFWMFVPGIIGARLFYVIQYWPDFKSPTLGQTISEVLNFSKGGLVVYGSLLGGMLGMVCFVRKHRLPLLALCDLLAPSLLLGLAIGRLGCLMHGCCFGGPSEVPWAVTFPQGSPVYERQMARGQLWGFAISGDSSADPEVLSLVDGPAKQAGLRKGDRIVRVNDLRVDTAGNVAELLYKFGSIDQVIQLTTKDGRTIAWPTSPAPARSRPVQPAQIYSAINAALLCGFFLAFAPFRRKDGVLFALTLTIYPITRFLLEVVRTDEGAVMSTGLSISQNISLLILLAIAVLWAYILKQPQGTALAVKSGE